MRESEKILWDHMIMEFISRFFLLFSKKCKIWSRKEAFVEVIEKYAAKILQKAELIKKHAGWTELL